jgi:hypothetical protein
MPPKLPDSFETLAPTTHQWIETSWRNTDNTSKFRAQVKSIFAGPSPIGMVKMKSTHKRTNALALSASMVALLAACGGGGDGTTATATPPTPTSSGPSQAVALDAAKAFLASYDATLATAIPTTGAAATALTDGCYLNEGQSKAYSIADFDADPKAVASRQLDIGSTRTNVQVVADRTATNADGTTRREIDIQYVVNYKDGTKDEVATETIISGSSSGAKLANGSACTTPDSKTDWRWYGNRRVVNTYVSATNERQQRTALATGVALNPAVTYSKYISLGIADPANVATYATVTGPGLGFAASGSGNGTVGTLKLLSPRLLRTAPELTGKRGNTVNWLDTDSFRVCSNAAANNYAPADTVDCVANGASGNSWGWYNNTSGTALDTGFATTNIKAGDVYTFNIYNDDGWKTVNGQAGKTPIATYTRTLDALPYSAAVFAGTGPTTDSFARLTTVSKTPAETANAIKNKATMSFDAAWSAPGAMPDGRTAALRQTWVFESGQANATGGAWPASRQIDYSYPGARATSMTGVIPAPVAALVVPTYAEISLQYTNRNGNFVTSLYTFQ